MRSDKTALAVVAGVAVGALIGVLFAPDKGSKTREKILDKTKDYADDLKEKFDDLFEEITDKFENLWKEEKEMVKKVEDKLLN